MIAFLSKTSHYTFRITCTSYNGIYTFRYTMYEIKHIFPLTLIPLISFTNDQHLFALVSPRFRSHGIEAEPGAKLRVCGMDNVNVTFPISIGRVRPSPFFPLITVRICIEGHDFLLKTRKIVYLWMAGRRAEKTSWFWRLHRSSNKDSFPVAHGEMKSW